MSSASRTAGSGKRDTGEWESEGGSLGPDAPARLPDGITAEASMVYRVGPYSYSRLDDAMAEHARQSGKQGSRAARV
ncbi:hypothetical protein [Erythrobacter sp. JK5]|uniref:hypothetical protein n=1 Tax=Erythrobacter sp. JK5 TaxID=2829500 RepID=UPI001BA7ABF0|nr:hypothetical protein [Erythrobacter sp. JK5]QUL39131.1 hypothetical protein KDC96_07335 [Erythrobacter sp. JK5]